jgi:hypothetical protein
MTITRRGLASALVLCLVVGLGFLVYAPALGGAFLLDDVSNLGGLAKVDGLRSALLFIFSGDAGPLGRPIALATFALQADAWGGSAEPFILVNILIHLVNGGLLCWVLHRLSILSRVPQEGRLFVVIAAGQICQHVPAGVQCLGDQFPYRVNIRANHRADVQSALTCLPAVPSGVPTVNQSNVLSILRWRTLTIISRNI